MKFGLFIATLLVILASSPKQTFAAPNTDFSACVNPQGTRIASYDAGLHGIVNNTGSYAGSDSVYLLSNGNAMQCFCGANNEGIQTNWLKNTGFSDAEISVLKNQGWTSIPDGSVWGLEAVQYFAMNSSYSCAATPGKANEGGSNTGGGSTSPSTNNGSSVLGASTTVLSNLANTGNSLLFYTTLTVGISLILLGLFLPRTNKSSR
jgi:hypothetical protein